VSRHFYLPETDSQSIFRAPWRLVANHPWRAAVVTAVLCVCMVGGMLLMQDDLWFAGKGKTTRSAHAGSSAVSTPTVAQSDASSGSPIPAVHQDDVRLTHPIRLQVLNGCAMKDMAKILAPQLRAKGFDVREVRRADSAGYLHTIIKDRINRADLAQIVADSVGVDRTLIITEPAEHLADIDVTIIIGADYRQLRFIMTSQKE
jgi:hypothetical protein